MPVCEPLFVNPGRHYRADSHTWVQRGVGQAPKVEKPRRNVDRLEKRVRTMSPESGDSAIHETGKEPGNPNKKPKRESSPDFEVYTNHGRA